MKNIVCLNCKAVAPIGKQSKKFCSQKCGSAYRWKKKPKVTHHNCRTCGKSFPIRPDQGQKWLCSPECRRARVAKTVREFHLRNPERQTLYRARTKAKQLPDSNLRRFRRWNPNAPMACEACGETRVLDMAHKPGCERNGEWRNRLNCKWPDHVWVLCPTCHALIDRMRYPPEDLGLRV